MDERILLVRVVKLDLPTNHGNPKLPSASASSVFAVRCFLTSSLVAYADEQCLEIRRSIEHLCQYFPCLSLSKDLAKDRPDKIQRVDVFTLGK